MSMRVTRHYWSFGMLDLHVYTLAPTDAPRYIALGWGRHEWHLWPVRRARAS